MSASGLRSPLLWLAVGLTACSGGEPPEPSPTRPNLVLVISDDHDPEHYGFAGHELARTPNLDRLAAGGYRFPVALTTPRCRPTLSGLLSGLRPERSGVYFNVGPTELEVEPLLPELLRRAGYRTYAAGKLFALPGQAGLTDHPDVPFEEGGLDVEGFARRDQADLFAFLRSVRDAPFFVWWAPLLPHVPHDPPARFAERFPPEQIFVPDYVEPVRAAEYRELEAASLAMVAWLDEAVGELLDELARLGHGDDTLIAYLADNGWANGLPSKGTPYERGVRTPLILSWPGRIEPGVEPACLASYLDVFPTLLDFAGASSPRPVDGLSLRPWAERRAAEPRSIAFGAAYPAYARPKGDPERDVYAAFARTARWKYVRWLRAVDEAHNEGLRIKHQAAPFPARPAGLEELFDLERDPNERTNLARAPDHAERLRELRTATEAWWLAR